MTHAALFQSKTFSPADLLHPPVRPMAAQLRRFALRLGLSGTRFAVNGILHHRFWVREHKLWEYARSLSWILSAPRPAPTDVAQAAAFRVLDFGGGATIPSFFFASVGCDVLCLDINSALTHWTNQVAQRHGWKLHASTHNLVTSPAPAGWPFFDAIVSFSVLEHIPKVAQPLLLAQLAALLKPGGVFALTFDFGPEAPPLDAPRDLAEVERLVAATGLDYGNGSPLTDSGERFVLDRRYPDRRFTFASLFLQKQK